MNAMLTMKECTLCPIYCNVAKSDETGMPYTISYDLLQGFTIVQSNHFTELLNNGDGCIVLKPISVSEAYKNMDKSFFDLI